ncbi:triose-phosphate transporter family-domain-containing protein [Dipodascopsis tothii]|uniref:triose-phosphate transporter family-domain-containing protein n=1 Tax=Dipodascopsis tothii TaxID=44089 RepID=UPI0034CD0895
MKDALRPASVRETTAARHVISWIMISSFVVLFNKWILYNSNFKFPIFLTTWHLLFSATATQLMSHFNVYYRKKDLYMEPAVYVRRIVPIALFYSLSLVCSNKAYLYLNVSFIQMLKGFMPVAVFVISYVFELETFKLDAVANLWLIVFGIMLSSMGEINLDYRGVVFEVAGIVCEASRLVLTGRLLHGPRPDLETKDEVLQYKEKPMDPLVCLYFFAPVCALFNAIFFLCSSERTALTFADIQGIGVSVLALNAAAAFVLNVSVVFVIGSTSSLVLTLCGIIKDILLVIVSSAIWRTAITHMQIVGYMFTVAGLVGYRFSYSPLAALMTPEKYKRSLRFRRKVLSYALTCSVAGGCVVFLVQSLRHSDDVGIEKD